MLSDDDVIWEGQIRGLKKLNSESGRRATEKKEHGRAMAIGRRSRLSWNVRFYHPVGARAHPVVLGDI